MCSRKPDPLDLARRLGQQARLLGAIEAQLRLHDARVVPRRYAPIATFSSTVMPA